MNSLNYTTMKQITNIFGDYERCTKQQDKVKKFLVSEYTELDQELICDIMGFYKIDDQDLFDCDGILLPECDRNMN